MHICAWKGLFFQACIAISSAQNFFIASNTELHRIQPPNCGPSANFYLAPVEDTCSVSNTTLANSWHHRKIKLSEFANIKIIQPDRLQVVAHPTFEEPVLVKIAGSLSEMPTLEQEARIYRLLQGSEATPEFLGHVTENERVIGFITEYIAEVPIRRRGNMQGCIEALRKLHERGIAHGDAHDGNCLIRQDGSAVLIDFELALETWSHDEFDRDLDIMGRCIQAYS